MRLVDMLPKVDGQIFVVGKKGSGKSTLVRQLITKLPDTTQIIVLDTKHEWELPRLGHMKLGNKNVYRLRFTNLKLVTKPGIYVYQSKYPHFYDPGNSRILLSAYNKKNVTIVIHELFHLCHGPNALPALAQAITQGRAKKLRLFLESQRPANVPIIVETEADVYVCMRLSKQSDRERMADVAEAPEMKDIVHGHDFWVITSMMEKAILISNDQDEKSWDLLNNKEKTTAMKDKNLQPTMP